jgi:hypothetical protein
LLTTKGKERRQEVRRGIIAAGVALATFALLLPPAAFGATAREIATDLADGKLDGQYTTEELYAFWKNATQQGYPPAGDVPGAAGGVPSGEVIAGGEVGALPFTGTDLALLAVGGLVILLVGYGLRRLVGGTP